MEREHALGEEKLKSACQISEERVKTAHERMQAMEQEIAATRSSTHFLKQQLDASARALRMSQDELERHKMRALSANTGSEAQHHQHASDEGVGRDHTSGSSNAARITSQSTRRVVRKSTSRTTSR